MAKKRKKKKKKKKKARKTHPARGLSKAARSRLVKRARKGKKVSKGGFKKVMMKAAKEYGSLEAGRRVAAAVMWKMAKKRGVTKKGTIRRKKK